MSDSEEDANATFIEGTHVPPNKFHYPKDHPFPSYYVILKKVTTAANRGRMSSATVAAIAALVKTKIISPYGNRKGWTDELNGLNIAYKKALHYEASHEDKIPIHHHKIIKLLDEPTWFDKDLPAQRKKNFDRRCDLFDLDASLNEWNFPDPPEEHRVNPRDEESSDSNAGNDDANDDNTDIKEVEDDKQENDEENANTNNYFAIQREVVEVASEDEKADNNKIRDLFKESEFAKNGYNEEYENGFLQRLKAVIDYRSNLMRNIAKFRKIKTLKYDKVRGEFNAYNHRMVQFLITFRVFYHLAPSSKKFARLLYLKADKLQKTIASLYVKQFKFLQNKKFIDSEGKRIKKYDSLDVIPRETYVLNEGKIHFIDKKKKRKRSYSEWDELSSVPRKKRKIDEDDERSDDEENYLKLLDGESTSKHTHTPKSRTSAERKLDRIIKNQNNLAMSVGILRSKADKLDKSPQQQSVDDLLNSDKRGIKRWSHEYHVNKSTIGFELISSETRKHQRNSSHQHLYQKMMNKRKNRNIVNDIQGKWVCVHFSL